MRVQKAARSSQSLDKTHCFGAVDPEVILNAMNLTNIRLGAQQAHDLTMYTCIVLVLGLRAQCYVNSARQKGLQSHNNCCPPPFYLPRQAEHLTRVVIAGCDGQSLQLDLHSVLVSAFFLIALQYRPRQQRSFINFSRDRNVYCNQTLVEKQKMSCDSQRVFTVFTAKA